MELTFNVEAASPATARVSAQCVITGQCHSTVLSRAAVSALERGALFDDNIRALSTVDRLFLIAGISPDGLRQMLQEDPDGCGDIGEYTGLSELVDLLSVDVSPDTCTRLECVSRTHVVAPIPTCRVVSPGLGCKYGIALLLGSVITCVLWLLLFVAAA